MDGRGLRGILTCWVFNLIPFSSLQPSNSFETEQGLRVFRLPRFIFTGIFKIGRVLVVRSMKIVSIFKRMD
jgi:hypothetical protein